ncbi:hypothetical protein MNBD_NITROSPINAE05-13 [hydrothermal vent metagenome]|uniref:Uncharacterized protein n=1 Tax=hydrothermal vent metagenome TaxID=652676 RepID=A0A3B1CWU0_9ZZZZ
MASVTLDPVLTCDGFLSVYRSIGPFEIELFLVKSSFFLDSGIKTPITLSLLSEFE